MPRKAFIDTMRDKEFLAEIKKLKLEVDPINGEELEGIINGLFRMKLETLAKLKEVLK